MLAWPYVLFTLHYLKYLSLDWGTNIATKDLIPGAGLDYLSDSTEIRRKQQPLLTNLDKVEMKSPDFKYKLQHSDRSMKFHRRVESIHVKRFQPHCISVQ